MTKMHKAFPVQNESHAAVNINDVYIQAIVKLELTIA
jgi:hypothetical protein